MLRLLGIFILLSFLCFLTACADEEEIKYVYAPPTSYAGKMCVMQCRERQMQCQLRCNSKKDACEQNASQLAFFYYEAYRNNRRAAGLPVDKTVNDFYKHYACDKVCDCPNNYTNCFSICGGKTIATSFCGDI